MVKIEHINKSFDDKTVLDDINFTFEQGKTNLIIGKSGAGKTVLLKILVGLLKPSSGDIYYNDILFNKLDKKKIREIRMNVGMLFQGSALFDSMTVEQNISFPMDMFTNMTKKEKLDRVNYCLDRVDLAGSNEKYPAELSGGMQKRIGIARAIVFKPKYLFCDEPNSGLDPRNSIMIDELIQGITKEHNITTIINTHDMNSVMEIGENILLLHQGKIVWSGNSKEVMTSDNEILYDFIFASPFLKRLKKMAVVNGN
jgi:phospholipid/cholesterol/gamma-HCH transport system ATP-binding protein